MPQTTKKKAGIFGIGFFILTIVLSLIVPHHIILLSGLQIVVFFSVFVSGKSSTTIAGIICLSVVVLHILVSGWQNISLDNWVRYGFVALLIVFTMLIVYYIKKLFQKIDFDKTHESSLFENATEGFIVTNSEGNIILVNPSACRMFGYEVNELVNQKIEVLVPSRYQVNHIHHRDGFYEKPQNRVMGHGRDLHGQRKGGETFPVEVSLSTYSQKNDRFVIAFIVDITHRKEIEKNMLDQQRQLERVTDEMRKLNTELEGKVEERTLVLKEALQRLEQSQQELSEALDKERELNEIKSRFVSMASHEFRTPLSTVLSSASLLSKYTSAEDQEKRDRHIAKIKASVKNLNDLLEDFLSLGKLDEGKVGAQFQEFNLSEVLQDTVDEMIGLTKENQPINYIHMGNEVIESDKKLVKNVLINLISNAIKFSEPGSTIHLSSQVKDDLAVISVRDEGIGISMEDQQHLFSSFFRGKNALNIQGTGLGLHIVKRYLDLLNGEVSLQSEPGKGTMITVAIPVKKLKNESIHTGY